MKELLKIGQFFGKKIRLVDGSEKVCNIVALLENKVTGEKRLIPGANIVTNNGDQYYAEAAAGSPSWTVAGMRLGTGVTAPAKTDNNVTTFLAGSGKAVDATYPKTNDNDTDNTGAGVKVVSWRVSYGTSEGNGTAIAELALVDNITTPTKALSHALFAATFNKTTNDTLKVFVNHTMSGI